ncbi:MAG: hypothetical protein H0V16_04840 [Burkholderiaceae bacterium]|nr:hypothetical protein [Burkholderiaceae bacterium]
MNLPKYALPIGIIAVTAAALASTSWLIALGVPVLPIALLPCAAMCALGMCHRKAADAGAPSEATQLSRSGNSTGSLQ